MQRSKANAALAQLRDSLHEVDKRSAKPIELPHHDRVALARVADQFSVFAGRVISCSVREAIYVLDGLLENDTVLRPREHMTDTHGYTKQLFGLCHLLGYAFMPRLADLKDQQLYRLDRGGSSSKLGSVFRGTVDVALIARKDTKTKPKGPWG